jgi:hypothetical protein
MGLSSTLIPQVYRGTVTPMARRLGLVLLAAAVAAGAAMVALPLQHGEPLLRFTADDAYISFRYADHFAAGQGPSFSLGGPRVDGYTSPLWMALIAATHLVGVGDEAASKVLSLLALGAIVSMLAYAGGGRAPLVRAVTIAALACSASVSSVARSGWSQ